MALNQQGRGMMGTQANQIAVPSWRTLAISWNLRWYLEIWNPSIRKLLHTTLIKFLSVPTFLRKTLEQIIVFGHCNPWLLKKKLLHVACECGCLNMLGMHGEMAFSKCLLKIRRLTFYTACDEASFSVSSEHLKDPCKAKPENTALYWASMSFVHRKQSKIIQLVEFSG